MVLIININNVFLLEGPRASGGVMGTELPDGVHPGALKRVSGVHPVNGGLLSTLPGWVDCDQPEEGE